MALIPIVEYLNTYSNNQVKDNKINLLVQQYEQFIISEDESTDSAFARFNTIITSLKALDEGYSRKNYVRKFLRALNPKWRAKVMTIEESKDLTSLSLNELIENFKVHEMIIKKDSKIVKAKGERKSLALKAKKESSDEECSTSRSEDEEYAMAVRDFKKFFKRRGQEPKSVHRRFGSWSDSGEQDDEKAKDETYLIAQASNEICLGVDLEPDEWIRDSECSNHMMAHASHKAKNIVSMTRCLELLHMDLFGLSAVPSYGGNRYTLVIVDDYSRAILGKTPYELLRGRKPTLDYFKVFGNEEEAIKVAKKKILENDIEDETLEIDEIVNIKESRNHPLENFIGNLNQRTLRLVAQGYNQQEGIDYDETYALVARLESIRIY
ncbi:retrovirus-related pol polyprotein from transposon TNT 1-94 [Tanacetum coccineum]